MDKEHKEIVVVVVTTLKITLEKDGKRFMSLVKEIRQPEYERL